MWNSPVTLKYAQGHWQSYHLKAVMWPCMQNVRKTVNEWSENRHFKRPHSHLTPPLQRTPANICIYLILPETTFPVLHFCRWQYMGSSANFRTVLSESRRRQPISYRARNRAERRTVKTAISLKRVKIEEKLLWIVYRNLPTLFRMVLSPTPYGLPFPKIGGSQPPPKTAI